MLIHCSSISFTDSSTPYVNCTDGEVRLSDGSNVLEGRVEVCINNAWGTVCDNIFSRDDSAVICHQLGFSQKSQCFCALTIRIGNWHSETTLHAQCSLK